MAYAEGTQVSVSRSRVEIEDLLTKHGATSVVTIREDTMNAVMFKLGGRVGYRFAIPAVEDDEVRYTEGGRTRGNADVASAKEKETRRRWRALLLMLKAKFEAVESGLVEFEEEFLSHMIMPGSTSTVYDEVRDNIAECYLGHTDKPLMAIGA